jgi:hypothetical protein
VARKRSTALLTRMDEAELEKYRKLVEKSKLTQQEYNLKRLLNEDVVVVEGIVELAAQIRKIGVNINQVAHMANEMKSVNNAQVEQLNEKLSEVWELLTDFVNKART